jgi:hypothetical protein
MTRKEALEGAIRTLGEMRALEAKKAKLLAEMERSLCLLSLWPEVFDHGAIKSTWISAPLGPRVFKRTVYKLTFRVTDGAGTVKEWPQAEVPALLWPMPEAGRLP